MTTSLYRVKITQLNLSKEQYDYLKQVATLNNKSMSAYIRGLLDEDMKKNMVFTYIDGEVGQEFTGGAS